MTTPGKDILHILITAALCCCFVAVALAEEEEEDKGWEQSAELSLVNTSGNSESSTFALKYSLSRDWHKSRFKVNLSGLRAESDTGQRFALGETPDDFEIIDPSESEVTAENYGVNGRYERDVTEKFFWFLGAGWERNEFAGVKNRFIAEAGGGNTWFKTDKSHFETSYALTGTDQEDVVERPGGSKTFLGVRLKSDYSVHLSKSTTYTNVLVIDESLDDSADLRADLEQGLAVAISDRMALKVSLQILFDNQPSFESLPLLLPPDMTPSGTSVLAELDDIDTFFKTALVIDF